MESEADSGQWLVSSRFWVCSRPFFESTLFVIPRAVLTARPAGQTVAAEDPDGAPVQTSGGLGSEGLGAADTVARDEGPAVSTGQPPVSGAGSAPRSGSSAIGLVPCSSATQVTLFDCDGALINTIEVNFPLGEVGLLPLDAFLESCKLESGFRQAQALVRSQSLVQHLCAVRLHDSEGLFSAAIRIDEGSGDFLPVTICRSRSLMLGLLNLTSRESEVRCRLYVGVRSPEVSVTLPPGGTRMLCIDGQGGMGLTDAVLRGKEITASPAASDVAVGRDTAGRESGGRGISKPLSSLVAGRAEAGRFENALRGQSSSPAVPEEPAVQGYLRFTVADGGEVAVQVMEIHESDTDLRLLQTA